MHSDKPESLGSEALAGLAKLAAAEASVGRREAAASVACIARTYAAERMLAPRVLGSQASLANDPSEPAADQPAAYHLARAKAYAITGEQALAEAEFRAALSADVHLLDAYIGLASLRFPGDDYIAWLQRFHETLRPEYYLEIGVDEGTTLALARSPTIALGVDPEPRLGAAFQTQTRLFLETSNDFFANDHLPALLGGRQLDLVFIDGLHVFEQSLLDFANAERFCGPSSVVLFHDTVPVDEVTQRPQRQTSFYTGDVWKTVICLKHYRPDLEVFTIATPQTGLTMVLGLDASSSLLYERYDEAVKAFGAMSYAELQGRETEMLNIIPNDWQFVAERLKRRGIA